MVSRIGMSGGIGDVRKRIFRLLKNILLLYFILLCIRTVQPEFFSIINFEIYDFKISGEKIAATLSLIFTIYFGYFILIDLRFFLDLANKFISMKLGEGEHGKAKIITYDIAVIIASILIQEFLTPIVLAIPYIGESIIKVINLAILALIFFIIYHMANELYYILKRPIDRLIEETFRKTKKNTSIGEGV